MQDQTETIQSETLSNRSRIRGEIMLKSKTAPLHPFITHTRDHRARVFKSAYPPDTDSRTTTRATDDTSKHWELLQS